MSSVYEHKVIANEISKRLQAIGNYIINITREEPEATYLLREELTACSMSVGVDLDWNANDGIDFEPRYCKPFPAGRFKELMTLNCRNSPYAPSLFEQHILFDIIARYGENGHCGKNNEMMGKHLERQLNRWLGDSGDSCCTAYHGAWSSYVQDPSEKLLLYSGIAKWKTTSVQGVTPRKYRCEAGESSEFEEDDALAEQDYDDKAMVHCAITIINERDPEDEDILISEVLTALMAIQHRAALPKCWGHVIYPAFVFSFCGFHVRMLQFHLDVRTQHIHIRKTPYLYIDGEFDRQNKNLFLRWKMNIPIGDTWLRDEEAKGEQLVEALATQPSLQHPIACH